MPFCSVAHFFTLGFQNQVNMHSSWFPAAKQSKQNQGFTKLLSLYVLNNQGCIKQQTYMKTCTLHTFTHSYVQFYTYQHVNTLNT